MDDIPECGGGGWTLVMKIDGNKVGFNRRFLPNYYNYVALNYKYSFGNPFVSIGFLLNQLFSKRVLALVRAVSTKTIRQFALVSTSEIIIKIYKCMKSNTIKR